MKAHWTVYVVEDGRAWRRPVEIGPRGDRTAIVTRGLSAKERVIVYPGDRVGDGVRVQEGGRS
ncbi:MAG: hypothetical protein FJ144_14290 [Deltaproteobacteria bacterium]|nr:hypothetical protein [Deltaproteobacteria bacterium]